MMLILPLLFTVSYWAFFGFVLGDWAWPEHAMSWGGDMGVVWRFLHAFVFTIGIFSSFAAGLLAHE